MSAVAMPKMHERAKQEREVDQGAQCVGAVFGEQQRACNDDKTEQDEACTGSQETAALLTFAGVVEVRHRSFLSFDSFRSKRSSIVLTAEAHVDRGSH